MVIYSEPLSAIITTVDAEDHMKGHFRTENPSRRPFYSYIKTLILDLWDRIFQVQMLFLLNSVGTVSNRYIRGGGNRRAKVKPEILWWDTVTFERVS